MQEKINIIKNQFKAVVSHVEEIDPWVYNLMEPAISEMHSMLLFLRNITPERLEEYRQNLHLLDLIITGMDEHAGEECVEHTKIWSYLYSLKDTLEYIINEEVNNKANENNEDIDEIPYDEE